MKKYVKGEYIEMSPEEVAEMENGNDVEVTPSFLERLEAIEAALLEGVLNNG